MSGRGDRHLEEPSAARDRLEGFDEAEGSFTARRRQTITPDGEVPKWEVDVDGTGVDPSDLDEVTTLVGVRLDALFHDSSLRRMMLLLEAEIVEAKSAREFFYARTSPVPDEAHPSDPADGEDTDLKEWQARMNAKLDGLGDLPIGI